MSGLITAAGIAAAATVASTGMSMMNKGGGGGGTATQTSQNMIDPGLQQMGNDNWDLAVQTANQLKDPYSGQRVANMTPEQQDLIRRLYGNVGSGMPAYDQAAGMYNGLSGFNSGQVTPQMLAGKDLNPYMNPYTQGVIDPTMKLMEQSRRQALGQIGDQATQARAFGGSRQGIAEGVTNAQSELQKGGFASNLYGQNFLNAQNMAVGDIQRDYTGQVANMGARQFDAGFQRDLAGRVAGLADARQNNWLMGVNQALGGQQMLQKQQQDELTAQMKYYNEQRQQPLDVLAIRQNALSNYPSNTSRVSTAPGPESDPWMTGLGVGSTTLGMIGSMNKMGMFGSGTKPPTMSTDETMKVALG